MNFLTEKHSRRGWRDFGCQPQNAPAPPQHPAPHQHVLAPCKPRESRWWSADHSDYFSIRTR